MIPRKALFFLKNVLIYYHYKQANSCRSMSAEVENKMRGSLIDGSPETSRFALTFNMHSQCLCRGGRFSWYGQFPGPRLWRGNTCFSGAHAKLKLQPSACPFQTVLSMILSMNASLCSDKTFLYLHKIPCTDWDITSNTGKPQSDSGLSVL